MEPLPSTLHRHVYSLPGLAAELMGSLSQTASDFGSRLSGEHHQVYLVGCGDSHHAALATALAFQRAASVQARPLTALQFARYEVGSIQTAEAPRTLVVGVSASGQVSRTVEALRLARLTGAETIAVTANANSPLAETADHVLAARTPWFDAAPGEVVPGARSYLTSLLALYHLAKMLGRTRGALGPQAAGDYLTVLETLPERLDRVIRSAEPVAKQAVSTWRGADHFVFSGAGPNYGTALFAAAKVLEASGDSALGQDLEEWAHLQYFGRRADTPTVFISAGDEAWDADRLQEVLAAALAVGRRVAVIAPEGSKIIRQSDTALQLPFPSGTPEWASPLLTCVAPLLLASHLAIQAGEPYFRAFGGGRSAEGGGGISRIRTSHQIDYPRR